AWRVGALVLWMHKLRKLNGPNFKWPLFMFSSVMSEKMMGRMGKIYNGKPISVKSRKELIAVLKPHYLQYLREDNGDLPEGYVSHPTARKTSMALPVLS